MSADMEFFVQTVVVLTWMTILAFSVIVFM